MNAHQPVLHIGGAPYDKRPIGRLPAMGQHYLRTAYAPLVGGNVQGGYVLAIIGVVLLVLWLIGFVAFHVTAGAIHILLALAVIAIILHFLRGGRRTAV